RLGDTRRSPARPVAVRGRADDADIVGGRRFMGRGLRIVRGSLRQGADTTPRHGPCRKADLRGKSDRGVSSPRPLALEPRQEAGVIDDRALVKALADNVPLVAAQRLEAQPVAVDLD